MKSSLGVRQKYDVFVSYARVDEVQATVVVRALRAKGLKVYFDKDSNLPGERWARNVNAAIEEAAAFICLISPNTQDSEFVEVEITKARKELERGGCQVIPVLIAPTDVADLPYGVLVLQYLDLSTAEEIAEEKNWINLLEAIRKAQSDQRAFLQRSQAEVIADEAVRAEQVRRVAERREAPLRETVQIAKILRTKVREDFDRDFLSQSGLMIEEARFRYRTTILSRSEEYWQDLVKYRTFRDLDFIMQGVEKIQQDVDKFREALKGSRWGDASDGIPEYLKRNIDVVHTYCNRRGSPLWVSCECIEPAALGVLLSLKAGDLTGIKLPLDVFSEDISGVIQMVTAGAQIKSVPFDAIVTAFGAFMLTGVGDLKIDCYEPSIPLHGERQMLIRRATRGESGADHASGHKRVHIYRNSSSHEQKIVEKIGGEIVWHDKFSIAFRYIQAFRRG